MQEIDILCLGEPMVEFNQQPDGQFLQGFGGDVSNVAIAAARSGARSAIFTHVGADRFGDDLLALWQREAVDTAYAKSQTDRETGLYFVTHDEEGHHFTYRRKGSAASQMSVDDWDASLLDTVQLFYSSGISLGVSESLRALTRQMLAAAKAADKVTAFDPNLRTALWPLELARVVTHDAMKHCDIALPGLDDARQLTGLREPEAIIDFYHGIGPSIVALTLGAEGVLVSNGTEQQFVKAQKVNAIDATGAGDCFNGAFLAHYLAHNDAFAAASYANCAAGLSTTGYGAVPPIPTADTIIQALKLAS